MPLVRFAIEARGVIKGWFMTQNHMHTVSITSPANLNSEAEFSFYYLKS